MKTGEIVFPSVMDTLLNDEIYYSLYFFLERCERFFSTHQYITQHIVVPEQNDYTLEINPLRMYFGEYKNDDCVLVLDTTQSGRMNLLTASQMLIHGGSDNTDISPFSTIQPEKMYEELGWMLPGHLFTSEVESELFQASTLYETYSIETMNDIINRIRNLPIKKYRLTISDDFRYPRYYKLLDKLLVGY